MASKQKPHGGPIPEFQGLRGRPQSGRARAPKSVPEEPQPYGESPARAKDTVATGAETRSFPTTHTGVRSPNTRDQRLHAAGETLADPGALFEQLSGKLATRVDKAASKAGMKVSQELSRKLTEELDNAIREAMSTADKVGTLVRQAVQAAVDDALRTAVLEATRVREQQLAQLALIDRTARSAQDLASVRLRIDAELRRSGLERVSTLDSLASFDVVNPGEHCGSSSFEVLVAAYVETLTGRVVERGEARQLPADHSDDAKDSA